MSDSLSKFDYLIDDAIKHLLRIQNALPETTDPQLLELGKKFGLVVITDAAKSDGDLTFGPIDERQRRICFELLEAELEVYDPQVIHNCHLQRLILCSDLRDKGMPVLGLAEVGRFVLDTLMINAKSITKQWEQACATMHHEIFHAIDYRDDVRHYLDPEWRKLNGDEYHYNDALQFTAGEVFSNAVYFPPFDFQNLRDTPSGFLNEYATQSVHEDKAVVYSWMIVRYADLMKICRVDPITNAKVAYMKELLARFHPSFDDAFWERASHRRPKK